MSRIFPCVLGRPQNIFVMPTVGEGLPAQRPGFLHGDPRPWIPAAFQLAEAQGCEPILPWGEGCDLLLAPYPKPGPEQEALIQILRDLSANFPVALYERDIALWPNLLLSAEGRDAEQEFRSAAAGLRGYRSAFRHRGRGGAEAFLLLPAAKHLQMFAGSWRAEWGGRGQELMNRRHSATALDYQRTIHGIAEMQRADLAPVKRLAVVMPHFDDDVIQCGAAILRALQQGSEVRVIWLTDGRKGVSTVSEEQSARIRHEEAERAMSILGVTDYHFLDAPETQLKVRGPWTQDLRQLLEEFRPDRVHSVWWADNNVDHFEANRVLEAAWPRDLEATIAASGLWQPLPVVHGVPIDAALRARKDEALAAYASQIEEVDYLRVERGLSRWYARERKGVDGLEAFLELPADRYWRAFHASGASRRLLLAR